MVLQKHTRPRDWLHGITVKSQRWSHWSVSPGLMPGGLPSLARSMSPLHSTARRSKLVASNVELQ
ncbi:hypothetical protein BC567DRAFT_220976 [Phyllosticta citribraziliensis]